MLSAFRKWMQALLKEEHELAEADSRFLSVDGLRVHYKAAPAPESTPGTGSIRSPQWFSPAATFQMCISRVSTWLLVPLVRVHVTACPP